MKKLKRSSTKTSPLDKLRSVSNKSPARDIGKHTVVQEPPRSVLDAQLENLFFSKQRPLPWAYYSAVKYEPLRTTGATFSDNVAKEILVRELDVNEALVVNHFEASIIYRPIPESVTAVADIKPGHFVKLDSLMIPSGRPVLDPFVGFSFDLVAEESALYEADNEIRNRTLAEFRKVIEAPTSGFSFLNTNVLANSDSSTSLYIFETGTVSAKYTCIDAGSGNNAPPVGFLPYGLNTTLPLIDQLYSMLVVFNIRGHVINKKDAQKLKDIVRSGAY
jgi:hypothetical protein